MRIWHYDSGLMKLAHNSTFHSIVLVNILHFWPYLTDSRLPEMLWLVQKLRRDNSFLIILANFFTNQYIILMPIYWIPGVAKMCKKNFELKEKAIITTQIKNFCLVLCRMFHNERSLRESDFAWNVWTNIVVPLKQTVDNTICN